MSRKRKYSNEFRLRVVQEYLSGKHGGFRALGEKHGMEYSIIRRWVHLYEQHGVDGLMKTPCGIYSGEFKLHVVEYMHINQMSLRETANYFCMPSHPTIAEWERIYYEEEAAAAAEEAKGYETGITYD